MYLDSGMKNTLFPLWLLLMLNKTEICIIIICVIISPISALLHPNLVLVDWYHFKKNSLKMFWKPIRIISGFYNLLFNNAFGLTSLHKLRYTSLNKTNDRYWQPTLAELGLELGRQPPPAQRRLPGQLPTTEQCSQISGSPILFVICTWTHQQVGREKFS